MNDFFWKTDIGGAEGKSGLECLTGVIFFIFLRISYSNIKNLREPTIPLIFTQIDPMNSTVAMPGILGSQVPDSDIVFFGAQRNSDCLFDCSHVFEDLLEEGVLGGRVET